MVRTRFAPSPTGYMHIGNLRSALYAWLFARNQGGRFLLRIEDTDQAREVAGAVDVIFETLREVGMNLGRRAGYRRPRRPVRPIPAQGYLRRVRKAARGIRPCLLLLLRKEELDERREQ